MTPRRRPAPRGTTIIELMIAMLILTVGLIGMWRMHIVGITSTAAGRRLWPTVYCGIACS